MHGHELKDLSFDCLTKVGKIGGQEVISGSGLDPVDHICARGMISSCRRQLYHASPPSVAQYSP